MITRMFGGTFLVTLCGIVIGALPISALADNPSVVHEVKHDRSQPLRDLAAVGRLQQHVGGPRGRLHPLVLSGIL